VSYNMGRFEATDNNKESRGKIVSDQKSGCGESWT